MSQASLLSAEQLKQVEEICEDVCERLETEDEYHYDLNVNRGKAGSAFDAIWDHALTALRRLGWDAQRTGDVVTVRKS